MKINKKIVILGVALFPFVIVWFIVFQVCRALFFICEGLENLIDMFGMFLTEKLGL